VYFDDGRGRAVVGLPGSRAACWTRTSTRPCRVPPVVRRTYAQIKYRTSTGCTCVRNKRVARASTGLITFGRGPAARVAVVSVSELSPCPDHVAIEQLAPVYACVMGVCLQLAAYAAWCSCMEFVAIHRELQACPARWCASWGRSKLADRAAEWGSVSSCSRSAALAIKTPCTYRCRGGQEKYIR
jgi:hypothetical protein